MDGSAISFGPFRLLATQRLLLEGDNPVRLGSRAFDILVFLIERAGEVVGKEELIARVWPRTFVEEANLKIQVSALRRALGDGQGGNRYIVTVVGRGYNFVAPVGLEESSGVPSPPRTAATVVHNLPFAATRMIGREEAVAALVSRLSRQRLVTIIGPGGIGKTTVALAVAEHMIASYEDGLWLVDLAPLGDPRLVPSAVATVLGLESRSDEPLPALVAALRGSRMLLVLDNCEPVIDAAASLAVAILGQAPAVSILATSREPLRVAGEREYRLGPLSSPQPSSNLTAADASAFPAVQLFVERVSAITEDFALTDGNAPLVAKICRRLDGLPLAIEFAAPRAAVLGVEGLAAWLDDGLPLLEARRRTAILRHQTMRAVLDWSCGLLSADDQRFFGALGIFASGFTVEAAASVAIETTKTGIDVIDRLADLVMKSLVVGDVSGAKPRFRLLDTTRAYALEKLDKSGDRQRIARRHADYFRELFECAEGEAGGRSAGEWLADYAREIDNLRAALNWALGPTGDAEIGTALTEAAVPLWMQMSQIEECRARVEDALAILHAGGERSERREMRLHAALGWSLMQSRGSVPDTHRAWSEVLELAESLNDAEYKWRATWGLWVFHFNGGELQTALTLAQGARALAANRADPADIFIADRMIGSSLHYLGDQASARSHMERVVNHYAAPRRRPRDMRFVFDPRTSARSYLARILWLQGFPDQAVRTSQIAIEDVESTEHALSLCNALVQAACPVALLVGDLAAAERFVARLLDCSEKHELTPWHKWGRCFKGILLVKRGKVTNGLELLGTTLAELPGTGYAVYRAAFLGVYAESLGETGEAKQGLAAIAEAIQQCERTKELWCFAELIRIRGEILLQEHGLSAAGAAEEDFGASLGWARRQRALSWELRTAKSLARLLRSQGHHLDAIASLQPIYDRFTEGFGTADLIAAKQLLDELRHAERDEN
jgi:predicted ATPase/DNA-binding winged helix-turn-helix (wHTH) protein